MPINLPTLPPSTPRPVQDAFARLQAHSTKVESELVDLKSRVGQMPAPLTLDQIRQALQAGGSHPLNIQNLQGTPAQANPIVPSTPSGGGGGGGGNLAPAPNHADIVNAVWAELGINPSSTDFELFKFAQTVVWRISLVQAPEDPQAGLLSQRGGDGVYNCAGTTYACFRFCYANGANIKILTGSYTAQWTQEANVPPADWRAPTDPATVCP